MKKLAALPVSGLFLMCFCTDIQGAGDPSWKNWTRGDTWLIQVRDLDAQRNYEIIVSVNGVDQVGKTACWRLFPNPTKESGIDDRYFFSIDQRTALLRKICRLTKTGFPELEFHKGEIARLARGTFKGVPFEVIPESPAGIDPDVEYLTKVEKQVHGKVINLTAAYRDDPMIVVKQEWEEGQKWWWEYERYVDGKRVLFAYREGKEKKKEAASVKKAQPIPDPYYLRRDARLQAQVDIEEFNPKLQNILKRLEEETKIYLKLDSTLANHDPQFGMATWRQAKAWTLMEHISETQLKNGKWERIPGGYKLVGISNIPKSSVAKKATIPELLENEEQQPKSGRRILVILLGILTATAGCLLSFLYYRTRKPRSPIKRVE